MAKRLVDRFEIGQFVAIELGEQWNLGKVVRHDHPGVWVQVRDGRLWFVTNGRRIKSVMSDE